MDYDAMREAYNATKKKEESVNMYPDGRYSETFLPRSKHLNAMTNYMPVTKTEHDYSIVKMPNGHFVVARSRQLGSLDYDFVCECVSQWEASEIVRGLNK